uniref:Uncharacterized protein n=1 Tax=Oryza nivara TaxID=4536 RepID=A0A679BBV4_ORYNI|nr:hypothetical protein [Oryza sativa f. spontanea]
MHAILSCGGGTIVRLCERLQQFRHAVATASANFCTPSLLVAGARRKALGTVPISLRPVTRTPRCRLFPFLSGHLPTGHTISPSPSGCSCRTPFFSPSRLTIATGDAGPERSAGLRRVRGPRSSLRVNPQGNGGGAVPVAIPTCKAIQELNCTDI